MTRSKLTRAGGFGALVGGTLWLLTAGVAQFAPPVVGLLAVPTLFLVVGLAGLQVRATRPGILNNLAFSLTLFGSLLLAYGSVGRVQFGGDIMGLTYGPFLFSGVAGGALVFGAGVALTAVSAIVADVLPRLSPIPLLLGGLGVAITAAVALARPLLGGTSADIFPFDALPLALLWVMFGLGWLWLGYLLWSEGSPDRSLAQA
jgi:hypothetical protein